MKKTVLIAIVLVTAVSVMAAWAQGERIGRGGPGGQGGQGRQGAPAMTCPAMAVVLPPAPMIDRMTETLGLTEDQVTKLKARAAADETKMPTLMKASADATKALRTALVAPDYDATKIKALATTTQNAEAALLNAKIDAWTSIRAILTADQVTKLHASMTMPRQGGNRRPGMNGEFQGTPPPPPPGGEDAPPPPPPPGGDAGGIDE